VIDAAQRMSNAARETYGVSNANVGMGKRWQKVRRQAKDDRSKQDEAMRSIFHISDTSS